MAKTVKMGIEIEYLMMTGRGEPIYSGWKKVHINKYLGLQILRDAAQFLQQGIERQTDAAGHKNVYRFNDGKILIPDTYTLLETVTAPSTNLDLLRDQLWSMKKALIHGANQNRKSIVSGSACPIGYKYEDVNRRGNVTANNAGMHIHLEAPNDKVKIKLCNMIMQVMPELTTLGVNSPIFNRQPSKMCSQRLNTSPLVGPLGVSPMEYESDNPLQFDNPQNRYRYITPFTKSKSTVEIRGFDTPITIDWAMAIAALIQCLAVKASRLFVDEKRNTVVGNNSKIRKKNFNAAMTSGLMGKFYPDYTFGVKLEGKRHKMSFLYHNEDIGLTRPVPATLAVKRLLYYIEAEAYELGFIQYLQPLYEAVRTGKDQAHQQLDWYNFLGYGGYFKKLKNVSATPPKNRTVVPYDKGTYFTVRQKEKEMQNNKVYLSISAMRKLRVKDGDTLVVSGPLRSLRIEVARDSNSSGSISLGDEEMRLGRLLRNRLGVSMYDPVIVGQKEYRPFVIEKTNKQWAPTGPIYSRPFNRSTFLR